MSAERAADNTSITLTPVRYRWDELSAGLGTTAATLV
jgi:hypothetical protein